MQIFGIIDDIVKESNVKSKMYTFNLFSVYEPEIIKKYSFTFIDLFAGIGEVPYGDITKIKPNEIPTFDMLLAGFPCQPFSMAGLKKGFEDTRGTLFFDILRIVEHHKPKVVFLENVRNLASHDKGNTLKVIIKALEDLNIKVKLLE